MTVGLGNVVSIATVLFVGTPPVQLAAFVQSALVLPFQVCAADGATALKSAMTDTAATTASRGLHAQAGTEETKLFDPESIGGAASESAPTTAYIIGAPQKPLESMPDYDSILPANNPTFGQRSS